MNIFAEIMSMPIDMIIMTILLFVFGFIFFGYTCYFAILVLIDIITSIFSNQPTNFASN